MIIAPKRLQQCSTDVLFQVGDVKAGGSNTRLDSQNRGFGARTEPKQKAGKAGYMSLSEPLETCLLAKDRREAHWDWAQATGDIEAGKLYPLFKKIKNLTREEVLLRPGKKTLIGYLEYQNSGRSPNSVRFGWDNQDGDGKCRCLISIPGKVLSAMSMRAVRDLFMLLVTAGLEVTRTDGAVDDFGKRLNPLTVIEVCSAGNYAKFRNKPIFHGSIGGEDWSIRFGSRESARSTILYNKASESGGKIDSYRLETKFGAKVAHQVILGWLQIDPDELGEDWEAESARYIMRSVVGSIDFIDRVSCPNEKNLDRIPRLGWWQEFIDLVGGEEIYHKAPMPEPSLHKATSWHTRQVMRSLVCTLSAFGDDWMKWLQNQLETARISLNEKHIKLIAQYREEYARYKESGFVDFGMT